MTRFNQLLDCGALVAPELTRQMKSTLVDPAIRHKFVKGLKNREDVRLYDWSRTSRQFQSDRARIEGRRRRDIVVGLTPDPHGGHWLDRMAAAFDDWFVRRPAPDGTAK